MSAVQWLGVAILFLVWYITCALITIVTLYLSAQAIHAGWIAGER